MPLAEPIDLHRLPTASPAMADQVLLCFQTLLDIVPTWMTDLDKILDTATKQQNELLCARQPADDTPPLRLPSRQPSLTAVNAPRDDQDGHASPDPSAPALLRPQLRHLTDSDALRLSQRKRKTVSVCSAGDSGPSKYRSRNMVVVHYDGDVQKGFESLVRTIGTCRNSIRKGKLTAKIDNLGRSGSSSSQSSSISGEETVKGLGTFNYRTTTIRRAVCNPLTAKSDGTKAFDNVDRFLEKAQSFCERAAHQMLRDGDCGPEINNAKAQFQDAMHTVQAELPSLHKKAAKAAQRRRLSDEQWQDQPSLSYTSTDLPSDGKLEVDHDNIIDDSDDAIEFDVAAMQLPPHLSKYQHDRTREPVDTMHTTLA